MSCYNAHDMARSFRTVRGNTLRVAEEIPEDQYSFRPAEGCRTVAETLAHIAISTQFPKTFHGQGHAAINLQLFTAEFPKILAAEAELKTKAQILEALQVEGEVFASWLETLSDEVLAQSVQYPEGMQPPTKTRFEMLLSAKEHEMHHRGQLMTIERMIGQVPHLTRQMQERVAQMQAAAAQTSGQAAR